MHTFGFAKRTQNRCHQPLIIRIGKIDRVSIKSRHECRHFGRTSGRRSRINTACTFFQLFFQLFLHPFHHLGIGLDFGRGKLFDEKLCQIRNDVEGRMQNLWNIVTDEIEKMFAFLCLLDPFFPMLLRCMLSILHEYLYMIKRHFFVHTSTFFISQF